MATTYKVLGQSATSQSSFSITNKALTNNVATITTSASHSFVVGQTVSIILTSADAAFDGLRTVATTPSSTTFTFTSINSNVTSASATGTVTGFEWSTLYTCPSATAAVLSSLIVVNRGTTAGYYSIAIDTTNSGEPANSKFIVCNDLAAARETIGLSLGLSLDATNKYLRIAASNANFTFSAHGMEIT